VAPQPWSSPAPPPPRTAYAQPNGKRSNRTIVLVAAAIVVLLAIAGGAGYVLTRPSSNSGANQGQGDPSATDDEPAAADTEQSDVDWTTSAEEYNAQAGKRIAYNCPAKGTIGTVWGSGPYTTDSSVCTAAVHAGWISLDDGGRVVIEIKAGQDEYEGSEQHGIVTTAYDHYDWSFDVVG
jgi:hypothetical protein